MPTKALLRDAAAHPRRTCPPGRRAGGQRRSWTPTAVLRRRDRFASDWNDAGQVELARPVPGSRWSAATGAITGTRTVTVTARRRHDHHARGAPRGRHRHRQLAPRCPPIPGLAEVGPWTSREAAAAQTVPERLAIIGGGVVGAEMATAYSALGSQVTVISRTRLLPGRRDVRRRAGGRRHSRTLGSRSTWSRGHRGRRDDRGAVRLTLSDGSEVDRGRRGPGRDRAHAEHQGPRPRTTSASSRGQLARPSTRPCAVRRRAAGGDAGRRTAGCTPPVTSTCGHC